MLAVGRAAAGAPQVRWRGRRTGVARAHGVAAGLASLAELRFVQAHLDHGAPVLHAFVPLPSPLELHAPGRAVSRSYCGGTWVVRRLCGKGVIHLCGMWAR